MPITSEMHHGTATLLNKAHGTVPRQQNDNAPIVALTVPEPPAPRMTKRSVSVECSMKRRPLAKRSTRSAPARGPQMLAAMAP